MTLLGELLAKHKWAPAVIEVLHLHPHGSRRFAEIHRQIAGISPQVLSATLKSLERDGFIRRIAYAEVPPRVEYELTDLGRSFCDAFQAVIEWALSHGESILAARRRYDEH